MLFFEIFERENVLKPNLLIFLEIPYRCCAESESGLHRPQFVDQNFQVFVFLKGNLFEANEKCFPEKNQLFQVLLALHEVRATRRSPLFPLLPFSQLRHRERQTMSTIARTRFRICKHKYE